MTSLRARDVKAVLDFVGEAYAAPDLEAFRGLIAPAARRMIPADYASYNEITGSGEVLAVLSDPQLSPHEIEPWMRLARQNPLVTRYERTRDGRAYRFTDVVTPAQLRELDVFREFYRQLGLRHQIAFALPSAPALTRGIALTRGGANFSERHREMLNLARPHLAQAHHSAALRAQAAAVIRALRRGLEELGEGILLVGSDQRVTFATGQGAELLRQLGGSQGSELPSALAPAGPPPWEPRLLRRGERSLLIRQTPVSGRERLVFLVPTRGKVPTEVLLGLGLTPREAQVLGDFTGGSAPAQVARRLGISTRTVHKHTQRIHAKLGTRDRAQAVATALAVWPVPGPGVRTRA